MPHIIPTHHETLVKLMNHDSPYAGSITLNGTEYHLHKFQIFWADSLSRIFEYDGTQMFMLKLAESNETLFPKELLSITYDEASYLRKA